MNDIEIQRSILPMPIQEIGKNLGILDFLEFYGDKKAKVRDFPKTGKKGKLILVTATNPTPYGEGKTTVSIGLTDALCNLGKKAGAVLREPSLGPVFGMKGGATGGGYAQVVPMEDINLHFTGDFHAITSANNLLASAIDNHIYHGNSLDIQEVRFKRCLDVNDRALREVSLNNRVEHFQITAASEVMTIFCLANSLSDLEKRLGEIIIGYNSLGKAVYAKELQIEGAMTVLLKDAFQPNLVQTLEHHPVLIHGGPFANISHGCNSIKATKMGLELFDYVVTEAGFGSDLGAEKFMDIKCRQAMIQPDAIVLTTTIRALKYNGGMDNLKVHIENMQKFGVPLVVAINQFESDTPDEIEEVLHFCESIGVLVEVTTAYRDGGRGSEKLAQTVLDLFQKENHFHYLYQDEDSIRQKLEILAKEVYHAKTIEFSSVAKEKLEKLPEFASSYSICVAKTQYSISDDAKKLGYPKDYELHVRDIDILNGARIIVVYLHNIMTMPGLSQHANYEKIHLDNDGMIEGIF